MQESWEYVVKLKTLNDDQLWDEYSKVNKQLVEVSKPYTQRSRRKNEGDDNYTPVSPSYEQFTHTSSKKRKKPAVGKNTKRKRQYGADEGGSKRKKRKTRDDTEVARKYRNNARRKPHSFEDSDDELSVKRKFGDDSDEEMSETSDFGRSQIAAPQNEYSSWSLKDIVERYVKYTKMLEKIKIKKSYSEQLSQLMKEKHELERKLTTTADELEHMQSTKDITEKVWKDKLQSKKKVYEARKADDKKRIEKLTEIIHHMKANGGSYPEIDPTLTSENLQLKEKIGELQAKLREVEMSARSGNGKVPHVETKGLSDQLWVEQKFSKEMQAHYVNLSDLCSKVRQSDSAFDSEASEAHKARITDLQNKLQQKEAKLQHKDSKIRDLQAEVANLRKQMAQSKGSSKRNRKNERKNKEKKSKPVSKVESLTSSLLQGEVKTFKESDLQSCLVCNQAIGELYKVHNPGYDPGEPTLWILYDGVYGLFNAPYRMYHRRCTRGEKHLKEVASLMFPKSSKKSS